MCHQYVYNKALFCNSCISYSVGFLDFFCWPTLVNRDQTFFLEDRKFTQRKHPRYYNFYRILLVSCFIANIFIYLSQCIPPITTKSTQTHGDHTPPTLRCSSMPTCNRPYLWSKWYTWSSKRDMQRLEREKIERNYYIRSTRVEG